MKEKAVCKVLLGEETGYETYTKTDRLLYGMRSLHRELPCQPRIAELFSKADHQTDHD